ncbi:ABC transporter ATP-binding protein [Alkaliphilus pronyensis]|uniref:ABC transporter ATP-binding protein n=1 Tax=Alkaliphilus pronyensis TaxID=1482732 RepID=A0A6I0FIR8_9FIRM|nr:ABC transporter ATP-binding protein [Alkaliphilus pronyensis]KAB3539017.1 ABC transporter ATP-binding protein [Alkaliphilus pronyensis]
MDSLVKLSNITKEYGTKIKTKALDKINLEILEGEFLSIIGQSGSGKSTLLNIMGTLDRPTDGELLFKGSKISRLNDDALANFRNNNLGFVFQFHHLLPELSVLENVLIPAWITFEKKPTATIIDRAKELIVLVGVENRVNNKPNELSGGQRQRVAIARSLLNNPSLVLADEPTGNLDSDASDNIYELLRTINKELNTTFIIVTHDMHIAAKADRVIEIKDGEIVRDVSNRSKAEEEAFKEFSPKNCLYCKSL